MSGRRVVDRGSFGRNANLPNALTLLRILLVPVFAWLLLADGGDDTSLRWWAAVVFVVAAATDRLDGWLARRQGSVTTFGIVADPIADKALTGAGFVGLSLLGILPWWVTAVVLVREVGVTVLRAVVIRHTVVPASRGGKLKTVLQTVALALLVAPLPELLRYAGWAVMVAAVVVTVVTGVQYAVAILGAARRHRAEVRTRAREAAERRRR
ncbi:CDP-diacylglycerol--glycerol-3-phosphate 3-phosphatidyltransferase [Aquipuribacter nitratireducens]|uniref:CDP-diacylglycerol--glycerol-3-phosphate 3-phosphatidyltransferase n=1 Tax=Aquipuribacter nitratireducens TaxID=650104 RepID=A0ABW0GKG5_9MICO